MKRYLLLILIVSFNFAAIAQAPTITSYTPAVAAPGNTVTITGTNFTGATAVSFGGTAAAAYTVVSATSITAYVGNGSSGDVSVSTAGGTANSPGFTYAAPPTITSFTPTTAGISNTVTITGTNLTGATAVKFGGVAAASFTVVSATGITAVPAVNTPSGSISVTTPGGTVSLAGYTSLIPKISNFTPVNAGPGATVTITGTNFTGATAVSFGTAAPTTSFTVVSPTTITAVVGTAGTFSSSGYISVTSPEGTGYSTPLPFDYFPPPTITSFSPASGAAGSTITINGTNLAGISSITIGGVAATNIQSGGTVTATVGAGASGPIVLTTYGGTATSSTNFTFIPAPVITSFSPTSAGAGVPVTITGTGLTGALAVSFGGTAAASYTVVSDTQILAVTGAGTNGAVVVTTKGGTTYRNGFTSTASATTAPVIQYAGGVPNSFTINTPVSISPTNTGGAVPQVPFGQISGFTYVPTKFHPTAVAINSQNHNVYANGGTVTGSTLLNVYYGGFDPYVTVPNGIAYMCFDQAQNMYLTYQGGNVVRKITPAGVVSVLAGSGTIGTADGTGTGASFFNPTYIAADASGNIYVAEAFTPNVRKITPGGVVTTLPIITTNNNYGSPLAIDAADNLYYVNGTSIMKMTPGGTISTFAAVTAGCWSLTVDNAGNLYAGSTTSANSITIYNPSGTVLATLAGFRGPSGLAADGNGNMYVVEPGVYNLERFCATGYTVTPALPSGLTLNAATGVISGTPNVITAPANYLVTAYNAAGISTTTVNIGVAVSATLPSVTAISPAAAGPGMTVTITGANFTGATAVSFGGTAATSFTVVSPTSITATVGTGTSGGVTVTTPSGTSAALAGFTFVPTPTITSFTPTSALTGNTVTITGTNLTGATAVTFGGTAASSFTVVSATSITAVVAAGSASGSVVVTTPGGTVSKTGFTFTGVPTITSISPTSAAAGTTVTITGTYLTGATAVTFGGTAAASYTVVSDTQITAVAGAGSNGSVVVTTRAGVANIGGFTSILPASSGSLQYAAGAKVYNTGTAITALAPTSGGGTYAGGYGQVGYLMPITCCSLDSYSSVAISPVTHEVFGVDYGVSIIYKVFAGGTTAFLNSSNSINLPPDIGFDNAGNMYIDNDHGYGFLKATPNGTVTAVAGGTASSTSVDGVGAAARFLPNRMAVDPASGIMYVSEGIKIRKIAVDGTVSTLAGGVSTGNTDGTGTAASFTKPSALAVDGSGNVFVFDSGAIRKITPAGVVTTWLSNIAKSYAFSLCFDNFGNLYVSGYDYNGSSVSNVVLMQISSAGTITTIPGVTASCLTSDGNGNLYAGYLYGGSGAGVYKISTYGYSISPALPAGLTFDGTTGTISGTPTAAATAANYTITAYNASGSSSATVNIAVNAAGVPPAISSFSPNSAATGTTVTIGGTNFGGATAVSFGGTAATSFTVVSATQITAVVGAGASGNISITTPNGTASQAGFTYYAPVLPTIASYTPTSAAAGTTVTITGSNFTGATAISFGGTAAASFTVVSATSITAVPAAGSASGSISVTTAGGTVSLAGFTFIQAPAITSFSPANATTGELVTITGTNLSNVTGVSFGGAGAATFTAVNSTTLTAVVPPNAASGSIVVTTSAAGSATASGFTYTFSLPANTFTITTNSATCKGSANGTISIAANTSNAYTYTLALTGPSTGSYTFTGTQNITGLAAGTYNLCFGVTGHIGFQQCFTVVVAEPKDLSVYTAVNKNTNSVALNLDGAAKYNISLNGVVTTATSSLVTLALAPGNNKLIITSDLPCQTPVEKNINLSDNLIPYPNPFSSTVNLNLGVKMLANVTVDVYNFNNIKVFSKQFSNVSGVTPLDLSSLQGGIYVLRLNMDKTENIFKIIKNEK